MHIITISVTFLQLKKQLEIDFNGDLYRIREKERFFESHFFRGGGGKGLFWVSR